MKIEPNENLPESRIMFEHHAYMVMEMGINGTLHLTERSANHGLDKVRKLPNGRIDLHTINEGARSIMNMIALEGKMKQDEKDEKK